jgi:hypothetical protein
VDITLITEKGSDTFSAPKASLTKQSAFFERLLSQDGENLHIECELLCFPLVFGQFIQWVNHPRHPIKYKPSAYSEDFWIEYAVSAWFLAFDLGAAQFGKYALSQFIQNCSLALFGPWRFIETNASMETSLRRFSNHWVAWNYHLVGRESSEYAGLQATGMVTSITEQTKDPRLYSLGHWYSFCGRSLEPCLVHDPSLQGRNIVFGERTIQQPVEEWGAEFEKPL